MNVQANSKLNVTAKMIFQVYASRYFYNPTLTFTKLEIKLKSNSSHKLFFTSEFSNLNDFLYISILRKSNVEKWSLAT